MPGSHHGGWLKWRPDEWVTGDDEVMKQRQLHRLKGLTRGCWVLLGGSWERGDGTLAEPQSTWNGKGGESDGLPRAKRLAFKPSLVPAFQISSKRAGGCEASVTLKLSPVSAWHSRLRSKSLRAPTQKLKAAQAGPKPAARWMTCASTAGRRSASSGRVHCHGIRVVL